MPVRRGAIGLDFSRIRPYGDTLDDGKLQLGFTLPVPYGPEAEEAALQLLRKLNLHDPTVVYSYDLGNRFTYFVAYASCHVTVDFTAVRVPRAQKVVLDRKEIERLVGEELGGRPIRVIGACTGTDAHTVGIDAILNLKGIAGHKGLESYHGFLVKNLGAQVTNEELLVAARAWEADAVLVSQVVTQKNVHIENLTRLVELAEAEGLRQRLVLVVGGPRITHELAMELGYDAGFGRGTFAGDVASFLVQELVRRKTPRAEPQAEP
jgi:beta-lysine 5,6-aminomutase beta subunit